MSANKKRERQAVTPPNRRHLDNLLDQALADSFPASDPVAINFDSPGDWQASEERRKLPSERAGSGVRRQPVLLCPLWP
jgi:hypothetical protein